MGAGPVFPSESWTWTVKITPPKDVGVPLMTPAVLNVRPLGSAPLTMDHWTVPTLPATGKAWVYGCPTKPLGKEALRITGGPTITVSVAVPTSPTLSRTWNVG